MINGIKNDNVWSLLYTYFPEDSDVVTIDVMRKDFTDKAIGEAIHKDYIQHIGNTQTFGIPQYGITGTGIVFRDKR